MMLTLQAAEDIKQKKKKRMIHAIMWHFCVHSIYGFEKNTFDN